MKSNLTRVIGIGNPLMGDDGIGIRAIELLQKEPLLKSVELIDGGCGGLNLLPLFADCQQLIIIDAADFDAAPGSIRILSNSDLHRLPTPATQISGHHICLPELLRIAEQMNQLPPLVLCLIQVKSCLPKIGLSKEIESALPGLLQIIAKTTA